LQANFIDKLPARNKHDGVFQSQQTQTLNKFNQALLALKT